MEKFVRFFLFVLVVVAGCTMGSAIDARPHEIILRISLEEGFSLPIEPILAGCNTWSSIGVRCVIESDETRANLWLKIADCPRGNWAGSTDYGMCGGWDAAIYYYPGCWELQHPGQVGDMGMTYEERLLRITAHEVGHSLGIMQHVPRPHWRDAETSPPDCSRSSDEPMVHPEHGSLCGAAVMNVGGRETMLSELDLLAFEMRDPTWSLYDTCR